MDDGFWGRRNQREERWKCTSALSVLGEGPEEKKPALQVSVTMWRPRRLRRELLRVWPQVPRPCDANQYSKARTGMAQQIQSVCMECQGHGGRLAPKDRLSCNGGEMVQGQILQVHLENELWLEDNTVWWRRSKPRIEPGDTARLEGPCCFSFLCDEKTFYMYHQHSFQKPIPTLHNQITLITTSSKADCQPLRRQRRWATWRHANTSWNMPIPYGKASLSS